MNATDALAAAASRTRLSLGEKLLVAIALYFLALKLLFAFGSAPLSDEAYYWLDDPDVVAIAPSRDTFDDWFDLRAHGGEDAIVLVVRRDDTEYWRVYFTSAEKLNEISVERFGLPLTTYELWLARDLVPPQ